MNNDIQKIINKGADFLEEQMSVLKEFCSIDCPTKDIEGNAKTVEVLKNLLQKYEISYEEVFDKTVGTHIIAKINPENPNGKIILNAHLDTFTGFKKGDVEKYPFRIDGNWAYGIGICDNKGGVVASLYSVIILKELNMLPDKEIVMIYNCDEEIGSPSGKKIFEIECKDAQSAYVFEPARNDNGILIGRNGIAICKLEIIGVTAHVAVGFKNGRSASKELAYQAIRIFEKTKENHVLFDVSLMNSNNGISDTATAKVVAPILTKDGEKIFYDLLDEINNGKTFVDGCTAKISISVMHPPMPETQGNKELYNQMVKAGKEIGFDYPIEPKNGSGDACLIANYGVSVIDGLGPYMKDIHTKDERMYIPSLTEKTNAFAINLFNIK